MSAGAFLLYQILIISIASQAVSQRQPRNITRADGVTDVFIPCPFEFRPTPSIWRIDGADYTSATIPSIYSITPSGLFINTVHVCLNQTSYQCVDASNNALEEEVSDIGILTVTSEGNCNRSTESPYDETPQLVLDHQHTQYGGINTTLAWKIVPDSVRANCSISRVISYRKCHQNNVELDDTTEDETFTLPSARLRSSGELVDIAISSLSASQVESCPSLINTVRINVSETEAVNLLLGTNNCTCVDVERRRGLSFAITLSNSAPDRVDIACRVNANGSYIPTVCKSFNDSALPPFFRVIDTTSEDAYSFCFGNISDVLSGLRLELYELKKVICDTGLYPYFYEAREYFRSFKLNVSKASARILVNTTTKEICFSSSMFNDCNLINSTQYNTSIVDNFGNVIFKATYIPESTCQTVNQLDLLPQCGPFQMSTQPFNDHIMYHPDMQRINNSDNRLPGDEPKLCTCLQAITKLTLTAMYNSQDASVEVSGHCLYMIPVNITIVDISSENGSQFWANCFNRRFELSIDTDGCDYGIEFCGYFTYTNESGLTDCLLGCSDHIIIPCSRVPTTGPGPGPGPGPSPGFIAAIIGGIIIVVAALIIIPIMAWWCIQTFVRDRIHVRATHHVARQADDQVQGDAGNGAVPNGDDQVQKNGAMPNGDHQVQGDAGNGAVPNGDNNNINQ